MWDRPPYALTSVDNALHLATVIRHQGPLRVTDAAERLGVSVSTAHRLLAMLVYRRFAVQLPDRRYGPGEMLGPLTPSTAPINWLRHNAIPPLAAIVERTSESAQISVMSGADVHFIACVECDQVLRVGDRTGRSTPARPAASGQVMLATLPPEEVDELYQECDSTELAQLRQSLLVVRLQGFALNVELTEPGVAAVAVPILGPDHRPVAAVSTAMPHTRFHRHMVPNLVAAMRLAVTTIQAELLRHMLHP